MSEKLKPFIKKEEGEVKKAIKGVSDRLKYAWNAPLREREVGEYEKLLRIPITKEFLGERVLDLGSGVSGTFAKEAKERGIEIFSLSPEFVNPEVVERLENEIGYGAVVKKGEQSIAGLAQELPYKNSSFDSVLSVWAVPAHLPMGYLYYESALLEILRVLKPGRKAFLSQISNPKYNTSSAVCLEILKDGGAKYEWRPIYVTEKNNNGEVLDGMLIIEKPEEKDKKEGDKR